MPLACALVFKVIWMLTTPGACFPELDIIKKFAD